MPDVLRVDAHVVSVTHVFEDGTEGKTLFLKDEPEASRSRLEKGLLRYSPAVIDELVERLKK